FSTEQLRKIDRYTIDNEPILSIDLMERAATAVTAEIVTRWDCRRKMVVFAGAGNNGGDALAVARMLIQQGYTVESYLFNPKEHLSPDCEVNRERLQKSGAPLFEVVNEFVPPRLHRGMVVIDGLFGSGLNRPLEKAYASVIQYINGSGADIVSIDIPSGMFAEDNRKCLWQNIVHPTLTLTLQFPKLSFFLSEELPLTGEWKILDIGLHPEIIQKEETPYHYMQPVEVAGWLKKRERFTDKYDYGHVLVVAGSQGMMGAAFMAAKAALRSGAGLVSVHSAARGEAILQSALPEAMFEADTHESHVTHIPLHRRYDTVVIGPGLGTHADTREAFVQLLSQLTFPIVVDADALNILQENRPSLGLLPPQSIITPHHREFDRLFGESSCQYDRLQKAREMSRHYHLIIVLKGAYTAVVSPDGHVYFNSTGNPGMATAGSGDTLSGVIGALLSQHYEPLKAALLGVMLHGLAGDIALREQSEESLIAGDICARLGCAFHELQSFSNPENKTSSGENQV
ncbi:MAG: NAD(P)H-hydrate dehydratase, partial [Porphyromonadaceae bacterium]|nr:NAD(P)H-hydrate dehydratase [Porphyromonadaceae bacterium]